MPSNEIAILKIPPYHYAHVLNANTNVVRLLVGPKTYYCLINERVVVGPERMISLGELQYCVIRNPVIRSIADEPDIDVHGQVKLNIGDVEYKFSQDPFPLYPGETLEGKIESLPVVLHHSAFRLRALVDFTDEKRIQRTAGDQWMFEGPGTYKPRKEVEIIGDVAAKKITLNTALCIEATRDLVDQMDIQRIYGEKWLITKPGMYLPGAYEKVLETRTAYEITDKTALHMKALVAHVDEFGKRHKYGEEWLITSEQTDSHICSVFEEVVTTVNMTVLTSHQYCVILDPVDASGVQRMGQKRLICGEEAFFLKPGETLENGVQDSYILKIDDGLILQANQTFEDEISTRVGNDSETPSRRNKIIRNAGDQWMIRGPLEYVPPIEVEVLSRRNLISLDVNEGIYVRNNQTGQVRAVIGEAYMLKEDESLWEKKLPDDVIELLSMPTDPLGDRGNYRLRSAPQPSQTLDLTRVVTYQVPHNAAVQVYDYRERKARVEFGPTLVMLGPDEQFTKLSLSGGKPKRPNMIKSICLLLGPDFCTDVITVETSDHARLSLQLSYNWVFDVPSPCSQEEAAKLFSVPDFIGDACKAIASRVRGVVAGVAFDNFHKNSARIIRSSVFGMTSDNKVRDRFSFLSNHLHMTSIDIQSVEPVDQRTRDALQKSVQLAIEITTNAQEATARHEAERLEQEARGKLERQRIEDETAAEDARRVLLENRVLLESLECTGKARSEAESRAEASRIESEAGVIQARLRAEALQIETEAELERLDKARKAELVYLTEKNKLQVVQRKEERKIEATHFESIIGSLGQDTLCSIATASADQNVRMLTALGLQSTLITDGTTPVNLLTTAHGLIGKAMEVAGGSASDPSVDESKKAMAKTVLSSAVKSTQLNFGDDE